MEPVYPRTDLTPEQRDFAAQIRQYEEQKRNERTECIFFFHFLIYIQLHSFSTSFLSPSSFLLFQSSPTVIAPQRLSLEFTISLQRHSKSTHPPSPQHRAQKTMAQWRTTLGAKAKAERQATRRGRSPLSK